MLVKQQDAIPFEYNVMRDVLNIRNNKFHEQIEKIISERIISIVDGKFDFDELDEIQRVDQANFRLIR